MLIGVPLIFGLHLPWDIGFHIHHSCVALCPSVCLSKNVKVYHVYVKVFAGSLNLRMLTGIPLIFGLHLPWDIGLQILHPCMAVCPSVCLSENAEVYVKVFLGPYILRMLTGVPLIFSLHFP